MEIKVELADDIIQLLMRNGWYDGVKDGSIILSIGLENILVFLDNRSEVYTIKNSVVTKI